MQRPPNYMLAGGVGYGTDMNTVFQCVDDKVVNKIYLAAIRLRVAAISSHRDGNDRITTSFGTTSKVSKTSHLSGLKAEIALMKIGDDEDSPSLKAEDTVERVVEEAYRHAAIILPTPSIVPDGMGGLIVEWRSGFCLVRLIVPASEANKPYIYSKTSQPSELSYDVSGQELASRLKSVFI